MPLVWVSSTSEWGLWGGQPPPGLRMTISECPHLAQAPWSATQWGRCWQEPGSVWEPLGGLLRHMLVSGPMVELQMGHSRGVEAPFVLMEELGPVCSNVASVPVPLLPPGWPVMSVAIHGPWWVLTLGHFPLFCHLELSITDLFSAKGVPSSKADCRLCMLERPRFVPGTTWSTTRSDTGPLSWVQPLSTTGRPQGKGKNTPLGVPGRGDLIPEKLHLQGEWLEGNGKN